MTTDYPKNLNLKPEGRRNIGRPETRWEYYLREEGAGLAADVINTFRASLPPLVALKRRLNKFIQFNISFKISLVIPLLSLLLEAGPFFLKEVFTYNIKNKQTYLSFVHVQKAPAVHRQR